MIIGEPVENVSKRLEQHGQGHLLAFWPELDEARRAALLEQIEALDWEKIDDWVKNVVRREPELAVEGVPEAPQFYGAEPADGAQAAKYARARELGEGLIRAGKVGLFVVAGGQGTRLGFDGPKGDLAISPVRGKTLFRLFAEYIAAAGQRYGRSCPWYVMTSPLNHGATVEIFERNGYYGLDPGDVFIFRQGTMPNFDFEGRILLAEKARLASSPDGHGGCLKALYSSGAVDDMKARGVELLSYWQVDNPLINILDPLFIGLHAMEEAEMSSKAVIKSGPYEKVGNFCLVDGRVTVIEYSDLPDELAEKRNPDGSLVFRLGSIAIHIISRGFVERLNADGFSLPVHRAVKKIPHIDTAGRPIEPAEPNGVKLETFIFDALPLASHSVILETIRSEEFAPTKNATGTDSIETTQRMMVERGAAWLESAGVAVPRRPDGSADCRIEIAPSFALYREDVEDRVGQVPEIRPGDAVYLA